MEVVAAVVLVAVVLAAVVLAPARRARAVAAVRGARLRPQLALPHHQSPWALATKALSCLELWLEVEVVWLRAWIARGHLSSAIARTPIVG